MGKLLPPALPRLQLPKPVREHALNHCVRLQRNPRAEPGNYRSYLTQREEATKHGFVTTVKLQNLSDHTLYILIEDLINLFF